MAITIYNTPNAYAPVYNQMIFTLSSTNVAQSNFRYIADIYVNGSSDYTRLEVGRNPSNNYGTFDVAGAVAPPRVIIAFVSKGAFPILFEYGCTVPARRNIFFVLCFLATTTRLCNPA